MPSHTLYPALQPVLRRACALLLAAVASLAIAAPDTPIPPRAAAPPSLETFFGNPEFTGAALSPAARFLAVRLGSAGGRERLVVVDLRDLSLKVVASFSDADIGQFRWVNEQRLVFDSTDKQIAQGDVRFAPGLYAVDRDGANFRQLAERNGARLVTLSQRRNLLPWSTRLAAQAGAQDSEYVYVLSPKHDGPVEVPYVNLLRLNTLTGHSVSVVRPGNTRQWMLDHKGEPRIAVAIEADLEVIWYRDPATDKWRKLAEFNAYTGKGHGFSPLGFGPDGTFYVRSNKGGDKAAVYPFDFAANAVGQAPLIKLEQYDFSGSLITSGARLLGARYVSDARDTAWFDPAMQALQKQVDALLPATINLISPAARPETPYVLVVSYSDRQPSTYALFNTESGNLNQVGASYPAIRPEQMASQQLVHYPARDGLDIPAWLTLPNGGDGKGKNLPLVVLVHGGPYVRGHSWGWDAEAQFLASRGYAVLQPEYRGSTGFGQRHYRAGWKQWGLKMQDDIADGAKWAISQGIAAPKRICIAGASYGGYATLMGLVNDPDLYQCGINWVGVTDIKLMYTGHWSFNSDLTEGWKQYGMPELIGDPVKDAAQLAATSPLLQAARIKQALLLAYGAADWRVPLYHGNKFRDAVKPGNPDVEWVVYEEEGHGWALPKTRIDFWGRVEKFLARTIGKP